MGCRIWCVVDKENTCCCLKCEEYEHCDMVCDSLDSYEYMEECPDYVKEKMQNNKRLKLCPFCGAKGYILSREYPITLGGGTG